MSWQNMRILAFKVMSNNRVIGSLKIRQPLHCVGLGTISCDPGVVIGYFPSPYFLSTNSYLEARYSSAEIRIGSGTMINNNISIIAERSSVVIGEHCLIGFNVEITDSDFHALDSHDRDIGLLPESEAVNIGDHVFIGSNVRILKGVTIGANSVIANSALVVNDIPAGVIAGGIPAKVLGNVVAARDRKRDEAG